jgi:hypothetical protein
MGILGIPGREATLVGAAEFFPSAGIDPTAAARALWLETHPL